MNVNGHVERTARVPGDRRPRSAVLLALVLVACAGSVAACGGSSTHVSSQAAESSPGVPAGEAATEAQAVKQRDAHLKKSEAIEEEEIKKKLDAVKLARARNGSAEREQSSNAKQRSANGEKQDSTSSHKRRTEKAKPKKTAKPRPPAGESPAEKAARRQFAKEEAQEQAAFKRQEREEAAGR